MTMNAAFTNALDPLAGNALTICRSGDSNTLGSMIASLNANNVVTRTRPCR